MSAAEHAGCIPGQCRAGDHHKAVRCGAPAAPIEGDVAAAIARVEKSRQTHIEWREHWRKYESHVCSEIPCPWETAYEAEQAIAGDMAHQEEAISGYDNVLAVLRSVAQRPGAVRCGEPADGATWGGGPSAEGGLTEVGRALEYLVAMANGHDYADALKIMDAEHEVRAGLAARSQRPEGEVGCGYCGDPLTGDVGYTGDAAYHRRCARVVYGDIFAEDHPAQRPEGVTVTDIIRQRELGWPDFHPEDYCHRCGGQNWSWYAPSPVWNAVIGYPEQSHDGIVCPHCFIVLAQAKGAALWRLAPRMAPEGTSLVHVDGRVWDSAADLWVEPEQRPESVTVDPDSPRQVQRLADHLIAAMCRQDPDWDKSRAYEIRSHLATALREYAAEVSGDTEAGGES